MTETKIISNFTLVPTEIGTCGMAWTEKGIVAFLLPEASPQKTEKKLIKLLSERFSDRKFKYIGSPKDPIAGAIRTIKNYLRGKEASDLSTIKIDLEEISPFYRKVYFAAIQVTPGHVRSYGEIAKEIGSPKSSRAVGQALGKNPIALLIPCHRIIAAAKKPGGFSAHGGLATKSRLLQIEGYSL